MLELSVVMVLAKKNYEILHVSIYQKEIFKHTSYHVPATGKNLSLWCIP